MDWSVVDAQRDAYVLEQAEAQFAEIEARAVALESTLASINDEVKQARFRVLQWAVAFYNTPANEVYEIHLPEGVTSIKHDLCRGREFATVVSIPEGVTYIGDRAFAYCFALKDVVLPSTVTHVSHEAFRACVGLRRLSLPAALTRIDMDVFLGVPATCDVSFERSKAQVQSMAWFPWGLEAGTVIRCTDGEIKVAV